MHHGDFNEKLKRNVSLEEQNEFYDALTSLLIGKKQGGKIMKLPLKINEMNELSNNYEDLLLHAFLSGRQGNKQSKQLLWNLHLYYKEDEARTNNTKEKLSESQMENYFTPQMRQVKMLRDSIHDENKLWGMNAKLFVDALFKQKKREKRFQVVRSIVNLSMKYNCKANQAYILCVGFCGIPSVETRRTAIKILQDEVLNQILF